MLDYIEHLRQAVIWSFKSKNNLMIALFALLFGTSVYQNFQPKELKYPEHLDEVIEVIGDKTLSNLLTSKIPSVRRSERKYSLVQALFSAESGGEYFIAKWIYNELEASRLGIEVGDRISTLDLPPGGYSVLNAERCLILDLRDHQDLAPSRPSVDMEVNGQMFAVAIKSQNHVIGLFVVIVTSYMGEGGIEDDSMLACENIFGTACALIANVANDLIFQYLEAQ